LKMNKSIKIRAHPILNKPVMIAAWPGIGNVAMIVATYLQRKLPFKKLGELVSSDFFDPIGVVVKDNLIEAPQFPQNRFYYWQSEGTGHDIILFLGESQPATKGYELAKCVLDVGMDFQIERVYTCAAALSRMHHTEPPEVWGVATKKEVADSFKGHELDKKGDLHIAGLNGLLLGVAKEKDIEGVCLLGEVPAYATKIQNPMAALVVTQVLTKMLGIDIDMAELTQLAGETTEKIKQAAAEAMGEYIDYFTEPIWEQKEEDEEDEEEEG